MSAKEACAQRVKRWIRSAPGTPTHSIYKFTERLVQRLHHERKEAAVLHGTSFFSTPHIPLFVYVGSKRVK